MPLGHDMPLPFHVLPTFLLMLFISQINGLPSKSYLRVCFQENPNITITRKKLTFFPLRKRGKPGPELDLHFESPESIPSSMRPKRKISSGLESWLNCQKHILLLQRTWVWFSNDVGIIQLTVFSIPNYSFVVEFTEDWQTVAACGSP